MHQTRDKTAPLTFGRHTDIIILNEVGYMTLQKLLDEKKITKYQLSKTSGVPKTTIIDICSGKSVIGKCSAKTIYLIAKALDCSMEDIMQLDEPEKFDPETGLPLNKSYLECGLPPFLEQSIENMKRSWAIEDSGGSDLHWDIYWCDLNADINCCEVEKIISSEQAWYLREKYLRMERN